MYYELIMNDKDARNYVTCMHRENPGEFHQSRWNINLCILIIFKRQYIFLFIYLFDVYKPVFHKLKSCGFVSFFPSDRGMDPTIWHSGYIF